MSCRRIPLEDGFSLIETVIAAGILITTLASLAQMVAWSVSQVREAGSRSRALVAAQDKLEELRAPSWSIDLNGLPVSDSALTPSPAGSLDTNTNGYFERLDATGRVVNTNGVVVVRRWAVVPIDVGIVDTLALTVCSFRAPAVGVTHAAADVCVSTARVRQP